MRDLGLQQPFPVLREHRRHPHRLFGTELRQTNGTVGYSEPAPSWVSERIGKTPAAEERGANVQVESTAFRCQRRFGELAIERDQHLVDNASDKPKRMLRWNSSPLRSSDLRIIASPLGKNRGIRFARPRQPPFSAAWSHVRHAAAVSRLGLSPDVMRRRQRLKTPVNKLSCAGWLPHDRIPSRAASF
jgi:hypothetical protein